MKFHSKYHLNDPPCKRGEPTCGCRSCYIGDFMWWFGCIPGNDPKPECMYNQIGIWLSPPRDGGESCLS